MLYRSLLLRSLTLLVLAYRGYRRLPARQRRLVRGAARRYGLRAALRHGPRVATLIVRAARPR